MIYMFLSITLSRGIKIRRICLVSKVIDISCNGHRNVLLNNCIIDKFVDTINGFVCITIVDGHSFL